jgi:enterochelin esterase-like enzyme
MHKRQDAAVFAPSAYIVLILFALFLILNTPACSPATNQDLNDVPLDTTTPESPTPTIKNPTPTSQITVRAPSPTAQIDNCLESGGEVQSSYLESELLGTSFEFKVYLPPCYHSDTEKEYSVAYLLHGLSYTSDQWLRLGLVENMDRLIADGAIAPFIAILPYEARPEPPQTSRYPEVLTQEFIPWMDSHYRTLPDKSHRVIGGVSRGAAWAVQIGFEHRDLFSAIGAHSLPLFQADDANIAVWVSQEPLEEQPRVFIDIGRNDQEWQTAKAFADLLDAHHIPHEWYMYSNGHTESYWSSHLEQYLCWYARDW